MSQRIDFLQREVHDAKAALKAHEAIVGHTGLIEQQAGNSEKFREIDTRFSEHERRIRMYEEWQLWWQRTVPTMDAKQNEKLYRIEVEIYGKDHVQRIRESGMPAYASEPNDNIQ